MIRALQGTTLAELIDFTERASVPEIRAVASARA